MTTTSSKTQGATSMAELMAKHGKEIQTFTKGEVVTGMVTKVSPQEILMQIDGKTDVMVMEKDKRMYRQLLSLLKVGEKIEAVVLYPESNAGYPAVTLRKFMEEKMWEDLEKVQKEGKKLTVTITDSTKGGLVAETETGVSGFLPNSHMTAAKPEELVGQKITVSIADIVKSPKKVVFSQKAMLTGDDFANIAKTYAVGTKVTGVIANIAPFGMFVTLPFQKDGEKVTIDGLVHISEISWEKVADIHDMYEVGQEVETVVIGVDPKSKRIDLSVRKLTADPFQKIIEAFPLEKKVTGIVGDMIEQGLEIDLGEVEGAQVAGFMKKDKIPPTTTYEKGQKITATVVAIDSRKRKIMLTPVLLEKPLMYR